MKLSGLFPLLLCLLLPIIAVGGESADAQIAFDKPPEPVGGMSELFKRVEYPEAARKENVTGTVLISLTIGTDGTVVKADVKEGVRADLDQAAMKAMKATKWIPAQNSGKPVEVSVIIPVRFQLQDKKK